MRIRFWGTRGSIPTPLMPSRLRSKISSVVGSIGAKDIQDPDSRERFLASLPDHLFSTVGGNTACVEVKTASPNRFILDAGTGIRELGNEIAEQGRAATCHLFFSHFHWDHIQGLPFFGPAYDPRCRIALYSPVADFQSILEGQMRQPYFPITMKEMRAGLEFKVLDGAPVRESGVEVSYRRLNHPGGCYSYRFQEAGQTAIYATDTELSEADFARTPENEAYFKGVDLIIIDSQYTLGEAIEKYNWGHSSFSLAADFAATWGIRKLVLFHHEPQYSDRKIDGILKSASWYVGHLESRGIEVILAREGLEVEVGG